MFTSCSLYSLSLSFSFPSPAPSSSLFYNVFLIKLHVYFFTIGGRLSGVLCFIHRRAFNHIYASQVEFSIRVGDRFCLLPCLVTSTLVVR